MRLLLLISLISFKLIASPTDFKLICPPDITVNCTVDYSNLDQFGKGYVDQNGNIIWVKDCKVIYNINECGVGTITRTWGVEDPDWKWLSCTQIITLTNINAFGEKDITWPRDLTIESCNPEQDLKNIGRPYDRPIYKANKCAKPMLNYSDSRYQVSAGCLKIIRTWKILDWCIYDPYRNPTVGIFSRVQIIKLITVDTAARISCSKELIVDALLDCKGVKLKIDSAVVNSPCNMPYIISNTSPYADTNTADASGFYPVGTHHFYYTAEYACGKELKCEITVKVNSKIPPVPYCKDGVIIDLMPMDTDGNGTIDEGMIDVWAKDLDHGSYHPCPGQKLNFSFSNDISDKSKRFTCKELGDNEVEIWITDSSGNQDHCKTKVIIQNNTGIPDCKKPDSLKHKHFDINIHLVQSRNGKGIEQALLNVEESSTGQLIPAVNNGFGNYQFKNLSCESNHLLKIEISKPGKPNFEDVRWLEKYIGGKIHNASAYQILAADLNYDHVIDLADLKLLKLKCYSNDQSVQSTYKFVPVGFQFSSRESVLEEYSKMDMVIPAHVDTNLSINYILIVDGLFNASSNSGTGTREEVMSKPMSLIREFKVGYLHTERLILIQPLNFHVQDLDLHLYNCLGQLMLHKKISHTSEGRIDLCEYNLSDGLYFVIINNELTKILLD